MLFKWVTNLVTGICDLIVTWGHKSLLSSNREKSLKRDHPSFKHPPNLKLLRRKVDKKCKEHTDAWIPLLLVSACCCSHADISKV